MSFVSYAQNYEDVMLARALRGVERGFYIDVGAQDPVGDSVTKAFYERGWSGVNIEPVTHWFERLLVDRPRDINLQLAVSDSPGVLHLFEVLDSGLSTTDRKFAELHGDAGHRIRESDVPCVTLDSLCAEHQIENVHFLKVDCEGGEAAALRGLSLDRVRPWIILVEATEPNSQKPAYEEWEPLLTGRRYHFVYQDGLNRFYVADEHSELDAAFAYPPNVFDYFVRAPEAAAREELVASRRELATLRHNVSYLHGENERREAALVEYRREMTSALQREAAASADALRIRVEAERLGREAERLGDEVDLREQELDRLRVMIEAIQRSTSWRVTYPLRVVKRGARMLPRLAKRLAYQVMRRPARLLRPLFQVLARSDRLCALCIRVVGADSWLATRTRLFLFGMPPSASSAGEPVEWLTRRGGQMLAEISDARARRQASRSSSIPNEV